MARKAFVFASKRDFRRLARPRKRHYTFARRHRDHSHVPGWHGIIPTQRVDLPGVFVCDQSETAMPRPAGSWRGGRFCSLRLSVRTPPFHGGESGSIPLGSASLPQRTASKRAPAPRNGRPDALMQVIPGDFGDDFEAGNRARDLDPSRKQPTDRKCVERPQCPPTDGLQDRSCVCFCSAERYHRVRLPAGR